MANLIVKHAVRCPLVGFLLEPVLDQMMNLVLAHPLSLVGGGI